MKKAKQDQAKSEIDFDDIVNKRTVKIRGILAKKAEEYATNENRFHNFDVTARIKGITPEQALDGMMAKQLVSVFDMIEWSETDPDRTTEKMIDAKIGDLINYLILLEGLMRRRIEES